MYSTVISSRQFEDSERDVSGSSIVRAEEEIHLQRWSQHIQRSLQDAEVRNLQLDKPRSMIIVLRLTCSFLLCCSALTSLRQYFGNNINCMHGFPDVPMAIFESYCFIQNTYTHVHLYNRSSSRHSTSHAHPGVSTGQVSRPWFL